MIMLMRLCNLIRIHFALSFFQTALFLLFPLFTVSLTAMTSILLTDGASAVLAPLTYIPETCPGALPPKTGTSNPSRHTVPRNCCKHPAAGTPRLGACRNTARR